MAPSQSPGPQWGSDAPGDAGVWAVPSTTLSWAGAVSWLPAWASERAGQEKHLCSDRGGQKEVSAGNSSAQLILDVFLLSLEK